VDEQTQQAVAIIFFCQKVVFHFGIKYCAYLTSFVPPPRTGIETTVPRHAEIRNFTAKRILETLS
jgi:hypothetical protein